MKELNKRILENLIWIREIMIAKGRDISKIESQISQKRKEIEKEKNERQKNL